MAGNITAKCSGDSQSAAISAYSATCLSFESVTICMLGVEFRIGPRANFGIAITASSGANSGSASATTTGTAKATGQVETLFS
jgi:hypothetical protein